jgi:probable HAF family extracellular repeat protein
MIDLGTLDVAARTFSTAHAINDHDQVVGASYITATASNEAFLWSNGVMTDLGSLPDTLASLGLLGVSVTHRRKLATPTT